MFQRIQQYSLIEDVSGRPYRPRAYGDPQLDGSWEGWLVFFPVSGGEAIASRETTQATLQALTSWAAGLTPVYLEGALARALELTHQPNIISRLENAEYEALQDAERLETAAEIERATATVDEIAAAEARADAERLRRERVATESAIAATEEVLATKAAEVHEEAARDARAVAAAARRSRHRAGGKEHPKRRRTKKK